MRLFQFIDDDGKRSVGAAAQDGTDRAVRLNGYESVYALASEALAQQVSLESLIREAGAAVTVDVEALLAARLLRLPVDHPEPARCTVSGTGLTHLGSASTRDEMAHGATQAGARKSNSMRMYAWGLERGRPADGEVGVEPEWFYKGDGNCLVAAGEPLVRPHFAEDAGEEPELAGVYL
ncbi:MAG: AraD1 family protein, partial [Steroidobacteraceae bacterium]